MCNIGDIGICKHCDGEIVFVDPYWDHPGKLKPRHPAEPRKVFSDKFEVMKLEINKLELKPSDILVIKLSKNATSSDVWETKACFDAVLPKGIEAVILAGDIQIYTISKDEQ